MEFQDFARRAASIGALAEPNRLALYRVVAAAATPVSRDQAAAAANLPLHTAKFHLDRLVDDGLLEVEYRRLSGRTGPGAGRPSKLYRRATRQVAVSLPERRYDLAGDVLAEAVEQSVRTGAPVAGAVRAAARSAGVRIGEEDCPPTGRDAMTLVEVLGHHGYEPRVIADDVCLTNCPFDRLAVRHTELVCGMNLALIEGVIDALRLGSTRARLEPEPGFCCVKIATPPGSDRHPG